jgi:hypothetical protein
VVLSRGEKPGLEIGGDDNLQEYIEVEMDRPTLNIHTRSTVDIEPSQSIVFRIGAPSLHTATMTGVGHATMHRWNTIDMAITISGTVDMDMTDPGALDVELSGVGTLQSRAVSTTRRSWYWERDPM